IKKAIPIYGNCFFYIQGSVVVFYLGKVEFKNLQHVSLPDCIIVLLYQVIQSNPKNIANCK
ncbi:MAG TPA: hypothetical protein DDY25_07855, partial [Peptococcaceae bacterium]|nr:hypothetical protein [Peptococcaceae bacterium]